MTFLSGLCAFPITPADATGHVDTAALRRLVARLVRAQVSSIGLLGSTGIYMYLTREERRRTLETAQDETGGRTPLVVGVGALRTDEAIKLAQDAKAVGAVAGLLSPVSYTPLTEAEVFEHFSAVARDSGLPIVIYDNPATAHFRFSPQLIGRLAEVPGIVAIKNPAGTVDETIHRLTVLRAVVPKSFSIGCSSDWTAAETMIAGADTWYSVLGGLFPDICLKIVRAAQLGDSAEVRRLDVALRPLWDLFRQFSSPCVVYALANLLDICHSEPPRPILPLADPVKRRIGECLSQLQHEIPPAG